MSTKWSHEAILSLLHLAHNLANNTGRSYSLTRGMQVIPTSKVLQKQGHEAILETCNPKRKHCEI